MMRKRFALLVTVLCGTAALAVPAAATAARYSHWHPRHNHGLTIAATPNPIVAGEGVLIYGQLKGSDSAGQTIYLFHRVDPASHFSLISVTKTNGFGFYEFIRPDGIVMSNRSWFVAGPDSTHSRTIHEWVSALVTMSASSSTAFTAQPLTFTGTLTPNHPFQRVLLQEQNSLNGNGWRTIDSGMTNAASSFSISHAFRAPGDYTLRAFFPGDVRNLGAESDDVTVTVQQAENPSFTIQTSAPIITNGQSATISGTLYQPGTTTPQGNTPVTLFGKKVGGHFKALLSTMTLADGSYSFSQMPVYNTVYRVETTTHPFEMTANLFQGVQDVLTLTANSTTVSEGEPVILTGTVTPDHTGHLVYLQRQDSMGNWENLKVNVVHNGSVYQFVVVFGQTGTMQLRARIYGGPENVGGASNAVSITVTPPPPVSSLPTA